MAAEEEIAEEMKLRKKIITLEIVDGIDIGRFLLLFSVPHHTAPRTPEHTTHFIKLSEIQNSNETPRIIN